MTLDYWARFRDFREEIWQGRVGEYQAEYKRISKVCPKEKSRQKEMKNVLQAFIKAVVILALVILVRSLISGEFSISWDDSVVLVIVIVVTAFATYIERKNA